MKRETMESPADNLSLSLQIQDKRIANPYELQAEMGLTKWAEVAVFRGFQPDEWIFGTEIGLLTKEPFLLSVGFVNWSPHLDVDPQPYIEAGYYTEHHKLIVRNVTARAANPPLVIATSEGALLLARASRDASIITRLAERVARLIDDSVLQGRSRG